MAAFPSIRIEGGLLGPDVLDQLLAAELAGQKPADFGLDARRNLTDEIAAAFADARSLWGVFQHRLARLPQDDVATSVTRDAWVIPFLGLLGYEPRFNPRAFEVDGLSFAVSHRAGEAEDAPPIHIVGARQQLGRVPESGRPRLAPHSLVQEYLNRTEHLWGLVTNGLIIRLLRDCTFVRRQAYVEFDLQAIIEEQRFQDFAALYRLLHRTRLPRGQADADQCLLEKYYSHSVEQGGRVREHLRDGVEECLTRLAKGFLHHRGEANDALRSRLVPGAERHMSAQNLYRQLLRLVYRFLFLLVSEDRGLLSPDPVYRDHYGIARVRRLLDQRAAYTAHDDLWNSLRVLWRALGDETLARFLSLAPLNGELFAWQDLDDCTISNRDLLGAFWHLAWYRERTSSPWLHVNYAALDVEELGSVYESLLDFHPALELDASRPPSFALVPGSERKSTASYYTRPQLVAPLLQHALEPLLRERLGAGSTPEQKAKAILSLKICDPACGSGHFLLAAARRLGKELARVRSGEDEPAPEAVREAIRDAISHCIYGVDKNPLAVDLCRVALWLEAMEPGKPLTFLDHHILCGNSLVGATPRLLAQGIPDEAFKAIEGDDKEACKELKRRNKREREGQVRGLFTLGGEPWLRLGDLQTELNALEELPDATLGDVVEKGRRFKAMTEGQGYLFSRLWADSWCAAFVAAKTPGDTAVVTDEAFRAIEQNPYGVPATTRDAVRSLAEEYGFFHWQLAFPTVFSVPSGETPPENQATGWSGGFDLVLGNPPWDTLSPDAKEFFSAYRPDVRFQSPEEQERMFGSLLADSGIAAAWARHRRELYAQVHVFKTSGAFVLFAPGNLGKGDFNIYRMFVELALRIVRRGGFVAQVVPENFYNGPNAMAIRQELFGSFDFSRLLGFENNREVWFKGIDSRTKFAIYTARKGGSTEAVGCNFAIRSPEALAAALAKPLHVPLNIVREFSPDALSFMEFDSQREINIAAKMYARWPKLGDESAGQPVRHYMRELDMGNDRDLFSEDPSGLPLYQGSMIHQFDHRATIYKSGHGTHTVWSECEFGASNKAIGPQWYIPRKNLPTKLLGRITVHRVGFRDVARPSDERSLIACLIPPDCVCGDKVPTLTFPTGYEWAYMVFLAVANSFLMDFVVRKKVSLKMSYTIMDSLPFPHLDRNHPHARRIVELAARLTCTGPEMRDYWDLLARDGWVEPAEPGGELSALLTENERLAAMAELDAIAAVELFGLDLDDLGYVLDQFSTVRRRQEDRFGEFLSRRLILEAASRLLAGRPVPAGVIR